MRLVTLLSIFTFLTAFMSADEKVVYPGISHDSFNRGEKLEYKVNFGIFTIGEGKMIISDKRYQINERDSYKVDAYGKTSGLVDWIARVDDHWGAYIDSISLLPHVSYRNIKEGNYRKNEIVHFDHAQNILEAKTINKKTGKWKEPVHYDSPDNVREMLSGFLYLRTMDFSNMRKGDRFMIQSFFEDTFYELEVEFKGREKLKTKAGKFRALKLVPRMPKNDLFDGEDSIVVWLSDDSNKIPLKVEAEMFIGHAGVELKEYANLKHRPGRID